MTDGRGLYRFATPGQWATCLRATLPEDMRLGPEGGDAVLNPPLAAREVVATEDGFLWIDRAGVLRRDSCAGPRLEDLRRLVADGTAAWVLAGNMLLQLDPVTLQHFASLPAEGVIDIAADGKGGVWLLHPDRIRRRDRRGRLVAPELRLARAGEALAAAGANLFVLSRGANDLQLRPADPATPALTIALDADFKAEGLSGSGEMLLIDGHWRDEAARPRESGFLLLSDDGGIAVRGRWQGVPARALLVREGLVALFGGAVARLYRGIAGAGGRRWLTPTMEADTLSSEWLRADAAARLPEGATLRLRWAASRDEGLRAAIDGIAADDSRPQAERMATIARLLQPFWSETVLTYAGDEGSGTAGEALFAFPLHRAEGHLLWLELSVHRNDAKAEPELASLSVFHDAPSLIDHLPAIYRTPAGDGDGTLRRLVGVLEATTQGLDDAIGRLHERLMGGRCLPEGLESIAGLIGLPFHPGLSTDMQRELIAAAPRILLGRGTRAAIEAALEALLGRRAFRIVDTTERMIPVALGASRLPAMLSGASARVPRLNARLVLGGTPLCGCGGGSGSLEIPYPQLIVVIPATATERSRHGAAIEHVLAALIPAGLRLRVRWTLGAAIARQHGSDVLASLSAPRPLRLGAGQALGRASVAGNRRPALRDDGIALEHRLD